MRPDKLKELLENVKSGQVDLEDAMESLARLPFENLGHTTLDHHRALRTGYPEVVFGESKTAQQIISIVQKLNETNVNVLVTRVSDEKAAAVCKAVPSVAYRSVARCLVIEAEKAARISTAGPVAIITAGTSDIPVAEEAACVTELCGSEVLRINDVGVAGVHRMLNRLPEIRSASVVIVVAGMEGALPSVIGGLVSAPVIAVPTSVGYGVSLGGVTALFGMLSSCASGITVVNIDNGFGAGYAASLMNRIGQPKEY